MYKMQKYRDYIEMYILERDTIIKLDIQIQFQLVLPPLFKNRKLVKASYGRSR